VLLSLHVRFATPPGRLATIRRLAYSSLAALLSPDHLLLPPIASAAELRKVENMLRSFAAVEHWDEIHDETCAAQKHLGIEKEIAGG
jgi:hypothetical protein